MRFLFSVIGGFFLVFLILSIIPSTNSTAESDKTPPSVTPTPQSNFAPPTNDFRSRITKKPFGLYVTPQKSPISPERFTGFHTGIDIEYGDQTEATPVFAITFGKIIYSGYVRGYGGVTAFSFAHNDKNYIALYGHLDPRYLPKVGTSVSKGDRLGYLGRGFTSETDWERKHLHLSIIKGSKINLRGYVASNTELVDWIDPLELY